MPGCRDSACSIRPILSAVRTALSRADSSLFVIASKSGTTIEPNSMAAAARRRVEAAGVKDWASRFVAITDDQTSLHKRALNDGFFDVFVNPSDVGGRYSALTLFGLVPAALIGAPVDTLLENARRMAEACRANDAQTNPGLALGALMGAAAREGRDKLTLLLPPRLEPLALWIEQLVAESTGKNGRGIVPIAGETPQVAAADDRVVVIVRLDGVGADDDIVRTLKSARVPTMTIDMPGSRGLAPSSSGGRLPRRRPAESSRSIRLTSPTCSRRRTRPTRCSTPTRHAANSSPSSRPAY
jgi:hypothetical protein